MQSVDSPCSQHLSKILTFGMFGVDMIIWQVDLIIWQLSRHIYMTSRLNIILYCAIIFLNIILISMHLLPWTNVLLNFICMDAVELQGTWNVKQTRPNKKMKKFLPTVGFEPTVLIIIVRLAPPTTIAWDCVRTMFESDLHQVHTNMYFLYIGISSRHCNIKENLFCPVHALHWPNSEKISKLLKQQKNAEVLCLFSIYKTIPNTLPELKRVKYLYYGTFACHFKTDSIGKSRLA